MKQDQEKGNCMHMIFTWKLKSEENHGRQQRHKIHYNMSAYKRISKQTPKQEINKSDKDLKVNSRGRDQLQQKSLTINSQ